MITLIAARARNGAIGKAGGIPWDVPEDLVAFQRETRAGAVIMGRKTWESLPARPLRNRMNIVVSSRPCGADTVVATVTAAIQVAHDAGYRRIYGIGGHGIYRDMLPRAHRLLITEIAVDVEDADAFFPAIEPADWVGIGMSLIREGRPRAVLNEYIRRNP